MENVLDFLANNYIWFLIAAVVLAFALVGFIIDSKRKEKKRKNDENMTGSFNNEEQIQTTQQPVQQPVQTNTYVEPTPNAVQTQEQFSTPTQEPQVNQNITGEPMLNQEPMPTNAFVNENQSIASQASTTVEPIAPTIEPQINNQPSNSFINESQNVVPQAPVEQVVQTPAVEPALNRQPMQGNTFVNENQNVTPVQQTPVQTPNVAPNVASNIFEQPIKEAPTQAPNFSNFTNPTTVNPTAQNTTPNVAQNVAPNVGPQQPMQTPTGVNVAETLNFGEEQK